MISSYTIRKQFIEFFKGKEHQFIRSSSVVPYEDSTLLFTNAGMNQFKPYFIGTQNPKEKRVVNSQKCIRVSGKHNDLEEVGVDNYHHTFFEMLGNWSFGDYYKKESISWAWELLTEIWKLDKNRLWITIFKDDEETGKLWKRYTDIDPNRILKFGYKDNFWEMGESGPCGPCTEIHYYTGDNVKDQSSDGVNLLAEYREIWNLVFIQYNRSEDGKLHDLPSKHVDTGAGFERLVAILNGKSSNYETDLFTPIIDKIIEISGKKLEFEKGVPHRVIADHIRMLCFSIADGAMPSNEGRGYVLRRVLRRAARFGRKLELQQPFIYKLVDVLCQVMGNSYPEIIEKKDHIQRVIKSEEESFNETLDRGLEEYSKITNKLEIGSSISGEDVFKLYDTFGFPLDLTELIARENGYSIDVNRFNECMLDQKKRAQKSSKFYSKSNNIDWTIIRENKSTNFIGYKTYSSISNIVKYKQSDEFCEIVLDKTPFYAESGGQIGDVGYLQHEKFSMKINDVQEVEDTFIHIGTIESGNIQVIQSVNAHIDISHRKKIQRNHTATHLLHKALKNVLGDHVQQAGSLVAAESLRFDLTHYKKITDKEIVEVESIVNSIILENSLVETNMKEYEIAREEGAVSLFGEKYGDIVRVVNISDFSKELCGGTHVNQTGEIGTLKIISESALATGVRRIVAVTGESILKLLSKQDNIINDIRNELKCSEKEIIIRLQSIISEKKYIEKENKVLKKSSIKKQIDNMINSANILGDYRLIVKILESPGDLKELGDQFRNAFKYQGVSLIGTIHKNKPMVMCAVTDDLTENINANNIVQEVGKVMGGGGGGKPHIATAGGNDESMLKAALEHGEKLLKALLLGD